MQLATKLQPLSEEARQQYLACDITFKEQCAIVWHGLRKGLTYDGCTGVPDFNFGFDCCGEHDTHYQLKLVSRAVADKKLRECIGKKQEQAQGVVRKFGYYMIKWTYWLGVRTLGGFWWNASTNLRSEDENDPNRSNAA